ncbi:hypothetical protein BDZ89DRAFT_118173 [Hymenopellis radicata]|nr:hypothetical protein BDZ89DRAFT_118173 [Hymenopellis radicata]
MTWKLALKRRGPYSTQTRRVSTQRIISGDMLFLGLAPHPNGLRGKRDSFKSRPTVSFFLQQLLHFQRLSSPKMRFQSFLIFVLSAGSEIQARDEHGPSEEELLQ